MYICGAWRCWERAEALTCLGVAHDGLVLVLLSLGPEAQRHDYQALSVPCDGVKQSLGRRPLNSLSGNGDLGG